METLFSQAESAKRLSYAPLAVRMRPSTLDEYVGQRKAVGPGSWLRSAIEHDVLSSVILYGPAGTGKTTLAHIVAAHTRSEFVEVSAVTGTVKDLRREIDEAQRRLMAYGRRTILFIDEIHRFSRSQQDALLHAVENRTVILILSLIHIYEGYTLVECHLYTGRTHQIRVHMRHIHHPLVGDPLYGKGSPRANLEMCIRDRPRSERLPWPAQ